MAKQSKKSNELTAPLPDEVKDIDFLIKEYVDKWKETNDARTEPWPVDWSKYNAAMLMKSPRIVAPQWYIADILASEDCMLMNDSEFATYHWLMYRSWNSEIQGFLFFNLDHMRKLCKKTRSRFIKIWENIVAQKFRYARHKGKTYIYNVRMFHEIMGMHENRINGSRGGRKRVENQKTPQLSVEPLPHKFVDSPYFDKTKFINALRSDKYYENINHEHYYERLKLWSAKSKNGSGMATDWIVMAQTFILNDAKGKSPEHKKPEFKKGVSAQARQKVTEELKRRTIPR